MIRIRKDFTVHVVCFRKMLSYYQTTVRQYVKKISLLADIRQREKQFNIHTSKHVEAQVKSNGHTLRKSKYEQVMAELYSYRFTVKG